MEQTLLRQSLLEGATDLFLALLSLPVDISAADQTGCTPLLLASYLGNVEAVEALLAHPSLVLPSSPSSSCKPFPTPASPLYMACQEGHAAVVQALLRDGRSSPCHFEGEYRVTPLFMACQEGHAEVASLLLADPRVNPNAGSLLSSASPLLAAAERGHEHIVRLLLSDARVLPFAQTSSGYTPLSLAAQNGFDTIVALLLSSLPSSSFTASSSSPCLPAPLVFQLALAHQLALHHAQEDTLELLEWYFRDPAFASKALAGLLFDERQEQQHQRHPLLHHQQKAQQQQYRPQRRRQQSQSLSDLDMGEWESSGPSSSSSSSSFSASSPSSSPSLSSSSLSLSPSSPSLMAVSPVDQPASAPLLCPASSPAWTRSFNAPLPVRI